MKQLILKKLIIVSKKTQEAKIVEFDDKLTIITGYNPSGETINRTGKSLLMKSIYYSMGAELGKYTANWNNLQIVTLVSFELQEHKYKLYRNGDIFVLDDGSDISVFKSISELRTYYVDFFNFKIKLPIREEDTNTVYAYPGAIFMPYYIDQDKGWDGAWDSFKDVFGGQWKQEILLYHLGVRTPEYYTLLEEKVTLENEQAENNRQKDTLEAVIQNHVKKYESYLDISVNMEQFAEDIAALTSELNAQLDRRNAIKEELVDCLSKVRQIEELYAIASKNYRELLADADYVDDSIQSSIIACPICGTIHKNSIENRFNLFREIEECESTMKSYFEERNKIEARVNKQSSLLGELDGYINNIKSILERKRTAVTFRDVVIAEGSKSILLDLRLDLSGLKQKIATIDVRLKEITKEQRAITRAGKHITELYLERLKENLLALDVADIDPKELKTFKKGFNSGGNDLPCAILAQVYAIREIAGVYSRTAVAPLVLDAIFQQEPAKRKINAISGFVVNFQPKDAQLIISTTDMPEAFRNIADCKVIMLHNERALLNVNDYSIASKELEKYQRLAIQK